MRILSDPIVFQWDNGNIHKNLEKHNVTTKEAEEIFILDPFLIKEDLKHSTSTEKRFFGLGQTKRKRKLFVAFTVRAKQIRIISIRDMKGKERQNYEES
jgi:uncharacterized DUF497 family protein